MSLITAAAAFSSNALRLQAAYKAAQDKCQKQEDIFKGVEQAYRDHQEYSVLSKELCVMERLLLLLKVCLKARLVTLHGLSNTMDSAR